MHRDKGGNCPSNGFFAPNCVAGKFLWCYDCFLWGDLEFLRQVLVKRCLESRDPTGTSEVLALFLKLRVLTVLILEISFHCHHHHHQNAWAAEARSADLVRWECPRPTARSHSWQIWRPGGCGTITNLLQPSLPWMSGWSFPARRRAYLGTASIYRHTRGHL